MRHKQLSDRRLFRLKPKWEIKMTNLNEYIQENREYLGDSLIVLEGLTEGQFHVLEAVTKEMGNANVGIDNSPVKSTEAIADFDNSRANFWAERGSREEAEIEGHKVISYSRVQMQKGQPRRDITVVQFSDFTITLL